MASPLIAMLFRNCKHDGSATSSPDKVRYALQCDNFAVQVARTPIQMPIPGFSPMLLDFGIFRPSITIAGIVPNKGEATDIGQKGFEFMEYFDYTRRHNRETGSTNDTTTSSGYTNRYYFPNKNKLEEDSYKWKTSAGSELELEIADANQPQLLKYADSSGKSNTDLDGAIGTGDAFIILEDIAINNRNILDGDYLVIEGENAASGDDADLLWEIVKVTDAEAGQKKYFVDRGVLGSTALTHDNGRNVYFYQEPSGGGVYKVAIQQARFQVDAAKEDRWQFQMQFVCQARDDINF